MAATHRIWSDSDRYRSAATTAPVQSAPASTPDSLPEPLATARDLLTAGVRVEGACRLAADLAQLVGPARLPSHAAVRELAATLPRTLHTTMHGALGAWVRAHVENPQWDAAQRALVGSWRLDGKPVALPLDSTGHGLQHALLERVGDLTLWAREARPHAHPSDVLQAVRAIVPKLPAIEVAPSDRDRAAEYVRTRAASPAFPGHVTARDLAAALDWPDDHGALCRAGAILTDLGWTAHRATPSVDPQRRRVYRPPSP